MFHCLFFHLPVEKNLACFPVGAILNKIVKKYLCTFVGVCMDIWFQFIWVNVEDAVVGLWHHSHVEFCTRVPSWEHSSAVGYIPRMWETRGSVPNAAKQTTETLPNCQLSLPHNFSFQLTVNQSCHIQAFAVIIVGRDYKIFVCMCVCFSTIYWKTLFSPFYYLALLPKIIWLYV